jgi:glycerol-3-phosphate acyltransferase PlsY
MSILPHLGLLILAYIIGAIPFGWLIVRVTTGEDVRNLHSGRTGGTNAMRAAGIWVGLFTAVLDVFKGASTVWISNYFFPDVLWLHVLSPIMAIIGHNYSFFLAHRNGDGKFQFGGGAGGAATLGGALGLWPLSGLIITTLGALIFYFIGYASITTMSIAFLATVIFIIRAYLGLSPWMYVLYGVLAETLVIWALRPNIKRLLAGTERLHGYRARHTSKTANESSGL